MSAKPGYRTTEFWLSLLATLLGFLMASGVMETVGQESIWAKVVGGLVAALAALGYNASRSRVKAGQGEK